MPELGCPEGAPDDHGQPDVDAVGIAREIALRQLTVRARTRDELRRALTARHVPQQAAQEVIDRFEGVGLINDEAFARDWVSAQSRRFRGRRTLARELIAKGIERDLVDQAVSSISAEQEYQTAFALARRRLSSLAGLDRPIQYRRLAGLLARRGFSASVVSAVVRDALGVGYVDALADPEAEPTDEPAPDGV